MRILDHRYSRDLRRHDLALRMIRHEVRTSTIIAWTGLSETRIRGLYRSYIPEGVRSALRHRGPSPSSLSPLLRSSSLNSEAAGLAGVCFAIGVLPTKTVVSPASELRSISAGERLCYAFELYQQLIPRPQITLDQLMVLVSALARAEEVALVHCTSCDAGMLIALLRAQRRVCAYCAIASSMPRDPSGAFCKREEAKAEEKDAPDPLEGFQWPLF